MIIKIINSLKGKRSLIHYSFVFFSRNNIKFFIFYCHNLNLTLFSLDLIFRKIKLKIKRLGMDFD
jgi:uncharacterized protein YlbG (UPF0298 family)